MKRRAFTIVELLMVIGVISVLITITATSVAGSMKRARVQKANVLCTLVKQGLLTYHAQKGVWPWGNNTEGNPNDNGYYTLSESEVKDAVFQMVKEAKQNHNPVMDISGLFVSESPGKPGTAVYGTDFMTAVRGSRKHPEKTPAGRLYYGYPEEQHGYFRRFVIKYSPALDDIIVRKFTTSEEQNKLDPQKEAN